MNLSGFAKVSVVVQFGEKNQYVKVADTFQVIILKYSSQPSEGDMSH